MRTDVLLRPSPGALASFLVSPEFPNARRSHDQLLPPLQCAGACVANIWGCYMLPCQSPGQLLHPPGRATGFV